MNKAIYKNRITMANKHFETYKKILYCILKQ